MPILTVVLLMHMQAPAALTADIDRLQDSAPGAVAANASSTPGALAPNASSAPHILDASPVPCAPSVLSQAGSPLRKEQPASEKATMEKPAPNAATDSSAPHQATEASTLPQPMETNTPHQQQQSPALQHPQQDHAVHRALPDAS